MSEYSRRVKAFMRTWAVAFVLAAVLVCIAIVIGWGLSNTVFDLSYYDKFKQLDKNNVLTFMSVVLAILIPLFILFLETMKRSGYVYKVVLPEITRFRELIFVLLICVVLVLISPRNAYLYFPTIIFVCASIFAVIQALDVVFRIEGYTDSVRKAIAKWVRGAFEELLNDRIVANKTIEWIDKQQSLNKASFWVMDRKNKKIVYAGKSGYLRRIRKTQLSAIVYLMRILDKDLKIEVNVLFGSKLNKQDGLVYVVTKIKYPKIWLKLLRRTFKITSKSPRLEALEKVLDDFEYRIMDGVAKNSKKLTTATVELYHFVTDELDTLIKDKMTDKDKNYDLNESMKDMKGGIIRDGLTKIQYRVFEILTEPLRRAIKESKFDTASVIISEAYGGWYGSLGKRLNSRTARNELIIVSGLRDFINKEALAKVLTKEQKEILDYIIFRIKDGTSSLAYRVRSGDDDEVDNDEASLNDALFSRIDTLRDLALGAYLNEKESIYEEVISSLIDILNKDREYLYHQSKVADFVSLNIYMILVALKHRNDLTSQYALPILELIKRWPEQYLLKITVRAVDDDLAEAWNIDMIGMPTNGNLYDLPNYTQFIKELWIEIMMSKASFSTDPETYKGEVNFEDTVFFTNGASENKNIDLLNMINKQTDGQSKVNLIDLVEKFIKIRIDSEAEIVASASLDQSKIKKYSDSANGSFTENAKVVEVFTDSHLVTDKTNSEMDFKQFGINSIFDKEMFMDKEWHIGYSLDYQGKEIGSNIARGVDNAVLSSLLDNPQAIPNLDRFIRTIKSIDEESFVFINKAYDYEYRQKISKLFTSESTYNDQKLSSLNQVLPVQRINIPILPSGMFVIRQSDLGKLTIKTTENSEYVDVNVSAFSEDEKLLSGLLEAKPSWLQEKGNEVEQKAYLLTKVRLSVGLVFKYKPKKSKKVYLFPMEEFDDGEG